MKIFQKYKVTDPKEDIWEQKHMEEVKSYWKSLWEEKVKHNEEEEWIRREEREEREKEKNNNMNWIPIGTTETTSFLSKTNNWKSPGIDQIPLTPSNLALNTFLGIRVPSILWTCPAHWSLFSLIHITRLGSPYSSYSSLSYLILHWPLSWTGPWILLNIFLSKVLRAFPEFLESVQVSLP
jgi:hypothetical protein